MSDNNPSDIETLYVFSGFDIELLNNNYFSPTSVIGNIIPGYVSNIIEVMASNSDHQQFIYLISELNKIGLVK